MSDIWFTSDYHLEHAKIIELCGRPYANIKEMHEDIIDAHNSLVKKGDRVYNLGDIAMYSTGEAERVVRALHGQIHLLLGNHDRIDSWTQSFKDLFVTITDGRKTIKVNNVGRFDPRTNSTSMKIVMDHYPLRTWNGKWRNAVNAYGHTHGTITPNIGACEVGVDIALHKHGRPCPFHIDEIIEMTRCHDLWNFLDEHRDKKFTEDDLEKI